MKVNESENEIKEYPWIDWADNLYFLLVSQIARNIVIFLYLVAHRQACCFQYTLSRLNATKFYEHKRITFGKF